MKFYFVDCGFFVYVYFRFSENIINSPFYEYFATCIKYMCILYIVNNIPACYGLQGWDLNQTLTSFNVLGNTFDLSNTWART